MLSFTSLAILALSPIVHTLATRPTCVIPAAGNGTDDAPAIVTAFAKCGHGGHIVFSENTTYNINTVMNTTGLSDVQIDLHGYLLWSTNISYWLNHSMDVGYQNQSTVWFLGGDRLTVNGYGSGTLDGNGQTWYNYVKGTSNYPHRPMGLTIWGATNSVFEGLRFVQSQMWTMAIMHSKNVLMQDIYVNSTSNNGYPARNTDGADVLYSDNITMRRWEVDNGDDAISIKGNSTNVVVEDCVFRTGEGFALGSIGQYQDLFEIIEGVVVRNITGIKTKYAAYVKTWTGEQVNYPPNGGGGGTGYIRNISITDFILSQGRSSVFSITQCTTYSGTAGDCDSSTFKISDITLSNVTGTIGYDVAAVMQCSAAAGGCDGIALEDIVVRNTDDDTQEAYPYATRYECSNVVDPVGFNCTGNVTSNPGGS